MHVTGGIDRIKLTATMSNKRQHTIPRFYLDQFLNPGWVYRRGAAAPRAVMNSRDVAVRKNYYGRDAEEISLDRLNSWTEASGAPALKKLIEAPRDITVPDLVDLAYLVANLYVRTPLAIEEMRAIELDVITQVNRIIGDIDPSAVPASVTPANDESLSFTVDELRREETRLRAGDEHLTTALGLFKASIDIAKCIQEMQFLLLQTRSEHHFVTSDRPVILRSLSTGSRLGAAWGNTDVVGSIAVSPHTYLLMFYRKPSMALYRNEAAPEDVASLNVETMKCAAQEIYSPIECPEACAWMKEVGLWKPESRLT